MFLIIFPAEWIREIIVRLVVFVSSDLNGSISIADAIKSA